MSEKIKKLEERLQEAKDLLDSKLKPSSSDYVLFGDITRELETNKKQENETKASK